MEEIDDEVYYKIGIYEGCLTVVCLQWFDEIGRDDRNYFHDKNGKVLRFDTEEEAEEWLNEHIKPEKIDPRHRKLKYSGHFYLKDDRMEP